jgi:primosomal protein N'
MYVIEVIPLTKGTSLSSLTYYSSSEYKEGTLVPIPIRGTTHQGLVVGSRPVSLAKTALKTATFSLRKLPPSSTAVVLPKNILETAKKLQALYPTQLGALLHVLLPPQIADGTQKVSPLDFHKGTGESTPHVLTDTTQNRYIAYTTHIREAFAHRGSVLFVVPTTTHITFAREHIKKGIEQRIVTFSSTHTKKEIAESYKALEDLSMAKVCIVTPAYAFIERHDFTTIIVEGCGSPYYIGKSRPYLDLRTALTTHAQVSGRSILFGDTLPRTEEESLRRSETYLTEHEHSTRLDFASTLVIAPHPKKESGEAFRILTTTLVDTIKRSLHQQGHVFLYSARKGLATLVTCFDCGYIFRCPDSGAPYSLVRTHKGETQERWFVSGASGKKVRAADTCPSCGGWRLSPRGIGVQQIYDEVQEVFPKIDSVLFDHTTATTHKKASALIERFYNQKKAILIGTHMALPYIHTPVDVTGVVSYEAMRATPTWRVDEYTLRTLLSLREKTHKDVVVQIRTEQDELLTLAQKGLIDTFYYDEIAIRKSLSYPPFAQFILFSFKGSLEHLRSTQEMLATTFGQEVVFYNAPEAEAGNTMRYALLRHSGPTKEYVAILEKCRSLPPHIKIEINPDRIV